MSGLSCLAILTCALPRPVSTYPGTWRVNCDCKRGWQPAISNRSNLLHMSPQAYPPLLALWRHQRIRLHYTLFTSYFSRRLPHSEPKPKKTNFRFFIKNRLKPNRVWKYHDRNNPRVSTNLAKWNSLSFPCFPDLLHSLFQSIIKWKPDVTHHISSQFGSFLAELQNILLNEHGDWLDPRQSLCHLTNLRYCYWQLCT